MLRFSTVSNGRTVRPLGMDGDAGKSVTTWAVEGAQRDDVLTITLGDTVAISGDGPVTVQLMVTGADSGTSFFDDITPAVNDTGPTSIIEVADAIDVTTDGMDQTASVEASFMRFKAGDGVDGVANNGLLASLGSFAVAVNLTHQECGRQRRRDSR